MLPADGTGDSQVILSESGLLYNILNGRHSLGVAAKDYVLMLDGVQSAGDVMLRSEGLEGCTVTTKPRRGRLTHAKFPFLPMPYTT